MKMNHNRYMLRSARDLSSNPRKQALMEPLSKTARLSNRDRRRTVRSNPEYASHMYTRRRSTTSWCTPASCRIVPQTRLKILLSRSLLQICPRAASPALQQKVLLLPKMTGSISHLDASMLLLQILTWRVRGAQETWGLYCRVACRGGSTRTLAACAMFDTPRI